MRVLVACEESQTVCKAFRERGMGGMRVTIISENDPELRGGLTVKDIKGEFVSPCLTCKRSRFWIATRRRKRKFY